MDSPRLAVSYSRGLSTLKKVLVERLEGTGATMGFGSVRHPDWLPGEAPPHALLIEIVPLNGPRFGLFFEAGEIEASAGGPSPAALDKIDRYVAAFRGPSHEPAVFFPDTHEEVDRKFDHHNPKDVARVRVDDEAQLNFWANELGVSARMVRDAVRAAGPISADVRRHLKTYLRGIDLRGR